MGCGNRKRDRSKVYWEEIKEKESIFMASEIWHCQVLCPDFYSVICCIISMYLLGTISMPVPNLHIGWAKDNRHSLFDRGQPTIQTFSRKSGKADCGEFHSRRALHRIFGTNPVYAIGFAVIVRRQNFILIET